MLRDLELATVTSAIRAERNIRSSGGALIVEAGEANARELGIEPGDVIVQINQTRIRSAQQAAQAIEYYGGRGVIRMILERGGQYFSVDFVTR